MTFLLNHKRARNCSWRVLALLINVANPARPALGTHLPLFDVADVYSYGNRIYIAHRDGITIYNYPSPSNISAVGTFNFHPARMSVDGSMLCGIRNNGIWTYNVTDPASVSEIGSSTVPDMGSDIAVSDGVAHVSWRSLNGLGGVRSFIVSSSSPPAHKSDHSLGNFTPFGLSHFAGECWLAGAYEVRGVRGISTSQTAMLQVPPMIRITHGFSVYGSNALVTDTFQSLHIIDTSNPTAPRITAVCRDLGNPFDVACWKDHAYVADGYAGVGVLDIADPWQPNLRGFCDIGGAGSRISIADGRGWVTRRSDEVMMLDLKDPSSPTLVGTFILGRMRTISDLASTGSRVYLTSLTWDGGLFIVDAENPSSPRLVSHYPMYASSIADDLSKAYAYVMEGKWLRIIDVSRPSSPRLAGSCAIPEIEGVSRIGIDVQGERAIAAWGETEEGVSGESPVGGICVFDVSDPQHPSVMKTLYMNCSFGSVRISGNRIFASSPSSGFYIFRYDPLMASTDKRWLLYN